MTFSQHAAQYKSSQIYYLILFLVVVPPFYWYMLYWFAPQFGFYILFKLVITFCAGNLLLAAFIPETVGRRATVHRFAAFSMAYMMLPAVVMIAFKTNLSAPTRIISGFLAAYMLGEIVFLKNDRRHPKMLIVQGTYVAAFHISIVAATYLR